MKSDRDEIVLSHLGFARFLAAKVARKVGPSVSAEDLEQEAMLALILVAERFDSTRGVPFMGYAHRPILGHIADYLRRQDGLSRSARGAVRALEDAEHDLAVVLEREPSQDEVAARLAWPPTRLRKIRMLRARSVRAMAAHEVQVATRAPGAADLLVSHEAIESILSAVAALPSRERRVLEGRLQHRRCEAIADELGVSPSRVSQLNSSARDRLRAVICD